MYDVICISDCCVDLIFGGLARIPALGTEEYCQHLEMKAGGGANTPMGLAKLGARTAYISAVGQDSFGQAVMEQMAGTGISLEYLQREKGFTTWVSAVLSTGQDRAFASYGGTPFQLDRRSLANILKKTRHIHTYLYYCRKFPFLLSMCREQGVTVSVDMAWEPGQTLEDIQDVLEQAHIFLPNDKEACGLAGTGDVMVALERIARYCPYTVITCGSGGCVAARDGTIYKVSAASVEVKDANGAGDLFNAGLLRAYGNGASVEDQLRMAAASGGLAVTYAGGMDEAYSADGVSALMRNITVTTIGKGE